MLSGAAGVALVAGNALLTLMPPPAVLLLPPHLDASLLDRLFPGVPGTWVAARLAIVAALVVLGVVLERKVPSRHSGNAACDRPWAAGARAQQVALAAAALQVVVAPWVSVLSRGGQLVYIAWLAVPALALALLDRDRARPSLRAGLRIEWLAVGGLVLTWVLLRVPNLWHAPLIATPADSTMPFEGAQLVLDPAFDLLTGQQRPGFTSLLTVLQGPILMGMTAAELTPRFLQTFQVFWTLVCAVLIAWLAATLFGRRLAPVAAATYLFAPLTAATTLLLGGIFIGTLFPALLLISLVRSARDHRPWALVAFGTLVGVSTTHPSLPLLALVACVALAWSLRRNPPPFALMATAVLTLLAAALPGVPSFATLTLMTESYSRSSQMWAGIEAAGFGLVPTAAAEFQIGLGDPGRWDLVLGTLLSPWATPRTAFRLWGDVMFEPIAAGFFAIGVGAALVRLRQARIATWLLLLFVASAIPGFISSYDRPSLVRPVCMLIIFALLAALGYGRIAVSLQRGRWSALVCSLAILGSGSWLFDVVQPRILARSSVSIAIAAIDEADECRPATFLRPAHGDVQQVEFFATRVPRCPSDSAPVEPPDSRWLAGLDRPGVLFWSPGLEEQSAVAQRICAVHPDARLWTIRDPAGLGRVFAATKPATRWSPPRRAAPASCSDGLETDATRAADAIEEAKRLAAAGDGEAGVRLLRSVARTTFTQAPLYLELAERLANAPAAAGSLDEAIYWARRAVHSHDWFDVASIQVLARLQARAGHEDAARAALERGIAEARSRGDDNAAEGLGQALVQLQAESRTVP